MLSFPFFGLWVPLRWGRIHPLWYPSGITLTQCGRLTALVELINHLDNAGSQISVTLSILVRRTQRGNLRHLRYCPYWDNRHPASCPKILAYHSPHLTPTSLSCWEDKCWSCQSDSSLSPILFICVPWAAAAVSGKGVITSCVGYICVFVSAVTTIT